MKLFYHLILCIVLVTCTQRLASGQEEKLPAKTEQLNSELQWLLPLVGDDTLLVARIRPQKWQIPVVAIRLRSMVRAYARGLDGLLLRVRNVQQGLASAGVDDAAILIDLRSGALFRPTFVTPYATTISEQDILDLVPAPWREEYKVMRLGSAWVACTQVAADQIVAVAPPSSNRIRVREALRRNGEFGLVIATVLSDDVRRAISEWELKLPEWLGDGLANPWIKRIESLTLSLEAGRAIQCNFDVELQDPANENSEWIRAHTSQLIRAAQKYLCRTEDAAVTELLQNWPVTEDNTFAWRFNTVDDEFQQLSQSLLRLINDRLRDLVKEKTHSQMRQVAIQMINHDSAYKFLPPAGGIPKLNVTGALSWRVHILPFLGEMELYEKFHLGEPWDSEHNRKLIAQMPSVFLLPNSKLTPDQGLSNICVPTGEETMWPMDRMLALDDVHEQATMLLEVRDDVAQVWTQPCELEIDAESLSESLGGHVADEFFLVSSRGVMGYWSLEVSPQEFKRRLKISQE